MSLTIEQTNYLQYVQSRWGLRTLSMLRAGYPTLLHWRWGWGGVRFVQAQDQQMVTTRSPRIITECWLTRSMLIKMYVHVIYSWFCIGTILSNRKHEYEFITTITVKLVWWVISILAVLTLTFWCLTLVFFTYLDVRTRLSISNLRLPSDRRTILIGRGPHLAMFPSPGEMIGRGPQLTTFPSPGEVVYWKEFSCFRWNLWNEI